MQVPGVRQAKFLLFPLLCPFQCVLPRIVFLATQFLMNTARQTAEKFNVSLGCVDNVSPGALLASSALPGIQLRARRGLRQNSADDRLVQQDALLCDGSYGAMPSRCVPQCGQREGHDSNAVVAAGVSGAHQVASFAGGGGAADCAYGVPSGVLPLRVDHGVSPAAAGVSGLARELSALQVASSARGPAAERAQLGGAGASRLWRQARSRCFDFGGLSDFVSSSRLGHLFHSPSLVDARVCHMNASFDTHHARVSSWGTLHAARINSGGHANSYRCTYNSCGGVRGGTKPTSMCTRGQVGCPAVEKLASLQQAPGRLHVETWAGRNGIPNLSCADMVTCLPPPLFSAVSPGPGREVRNGISWSLVEKTARSGVWLFRCALSGSSAFFCICCIC